MENKEACVGVNWSRMVVKVEKETKQTKTKLHFIQDYYNVGEKRSQYGTGLSFKYSKEK